MKISYPRDAAPRASSTGMGACSAVDLTRAARAVWRANLRGADSLDVRASCARMRVRFGSSLWDSAQRVGESVSEPVSRTGGEETFDAAAPQCLARATIRTVRRAASTSGLFESRPHGLDGRERGTNQGARGRTAGVGEGEVGERVRHTVRNVSATEARNFKFIHIYTHIINLFNFKKKGWTSSFDLNKLCLAQER